ncbi:MAG: hypothetical protein WC877_06225, partial [Dehalococcoidales bacterium]
LHCQTRFIPVKRIGQSPGWVCKKKTFRLIAAVMDLDNPCILSITVTLARLCLSRLAGTLYC